MDQAPPPGYPCGRPPIAGSAPMATASHSYPSQYATNSWSQQPPPPHHQPYYQQPQHHQHQQPMQQNYAYQPPPQHQHSYPSQPNGQPPYGAYPPAPTQPPAPGHYDPYYSQPPPPSHGMPPTSYGAPPPPQGYAQTPYGGPPVSGPPSNYPPPYGGGGGDMGAPMYGAPSGYGAQPAAYSQPSYGQPALQHAGSYPNASAPPGAGSSSSMPLPGIGVGPMHPMPALDPYGLPVVVGDQRQERCRMRIEEKVLESTGDSFYIMDERKRPMYTVDGSRTADEYKVLKNAAGGPLLCMRQTSTLKRKMVIADMANVPVLTLVRAADDRDRKRVDGYIGSECGGPPAVVIVGNNTASSFKIENNREVVVADVSRASRSVKRLVTGQDSYSVNVSVGAPALIAMMVVAIDEMFCDPHR